MSTRGAIARIINADGLSFEGRYHHFDAYPEGLGQTLFQLVRSQQLGNLEATLKVLIDDHPAGWSTINGGSDGGVDWSKAPGYTEYPNRRPEDSQRRAECYCHGDRSEEEWLVTQENASASGIEYVYAFDIPRRHLLVLSSYRPNGQKMIGMFGYGDKDARWAVLADIDLNGTEPDWQAIQEAAHANA